MRTRYFQHVEFEGSTIISRWAAHNRPQNFGSKVTVRDLQYLLQITDFVLSKYSVSQDDICKVGELRIRTSVHTNTWVLDS